MDEVVHTEPEIPKEPFFERRLWRGVFSFVAVILMLLALWVLFPSEYWRF